MSGATHSQATPTPHDAAAVAAVQRLSSVPSILEVCCRLTGMGFAAVARVTPDEWTACAVRDEIAFGLEPGGQLAVETTICHEIRQSPTPVLFDHAEADDAWRDHHTVKLYGLQSYISVPILRADGSMFGTLCAIDPRPHEVSRPEVLPTFELFAQLISTQLDAEDRLTASEAALLDEREVSQLRDQFIAVLGHDLRNPVAAIDAGAQLLERTDLTDRQRGLVVGIRGATGRMSKLINDVLDFARGRLGGGLPVEGRDPVLLGPVLDQVIAEIRAATNRPITTHLRLDRSIACDPGRVGQLLGNLISNAITHGEGEVRVSAVRDDAGLTLSVANGGQPIPEAARARLFEPFQRNDASEGLGLGLYIAAQIAQSHGGRIDMVSDETETRFTFQIPDR